MKNFTTFNNFLNEANDESGEIMNQFKFSIEVASVKMHSEPGDAENFAFDLVMTNGDKISYESHFVSNPYQTFRNDDYEYLKINGKKFKMNSDEEMQNIYGAAAAYRRYLKLKPMR